MVGYTGNLEAPCPVALDAQLHQAPARLVQATGLGHTTLKQGTVSSCGGAGFRSRENRHPHLIDTDTRQLIVSYGN